MRHFKNEFSSAETYSGLTTLQQWALYKAVEFHLTRIRDLLTEMETSADALAELRRLVGLPPTDTLADSP